MKINKLLLTGAAAFALVGTSLADTTINITGSTAFRAAVVKAIIDSYDTPANVTVAYTGSSINGGNQQLFKGTMTGTGLSGTTYIRTSWNGSVEGVLAVKTPATYPTTYIPIAAATGAWSTGGSAGAYTLGGGTFYNNAGDSATYPLETAIPKMAYSDVYLASTGVSGLSDSSANYIGVVPFQWIANFGAASQPFTGMTTQIANAMLTNGWVAFSQFTGNSADSAKIAFATGRYNGSGTRATTLAEIGYGVFNAVKQYQLTTSGAAGSISSLQLWPTTSVGNLSGQVNDAIAGNGGYNGGGDLKDAIDGTFTDPVATPLTNGSSSYSKANIAAIGYLGIADAYKALTVGTGTCKALTFNGFSYSQTNCEQGQYTFWGYEHCITGTLASNESTVRGKIKTNVPNAFTFYGVNASPGFTIASMTVSRTKDGGLVGP